jgi:hypothetical protein
MGENIKIDFDEISCDNLRDEVTAEWRELHNQELHKLYCSPYIIRRIKVRRMR